LEEDVASIIRVKQYAKHKISMKAGGKQAQTHDADIMIQ
jgi:hypothetical protein